MKLLCRSNSRTGNAGLSSVGLSLPTELTRKQSKMQEGQSCSSNGVEALLLVDRDSPAEPQGVSPLKSILKGTAGVWEAGEKAGDVQRQGHIPSAQFLLSRLKNRSVVGSTVKRMRHMSGNSVKCSLLAQL